MRRGRLVPFPERRSELPRGDWTIARAEVGNHGRTVNRDRMIDALTTYRESSARGTHYIQDHATEVLLLVVWRKSGQWEGLLIGQEFFIAEYFDEFDRAKDQVIEWFRRAFPRHVCDSGCDMHKFLESSHP